MHYSYLDVDIRSVPLYAGSSHSPNTTVIFPSFLVVMHLRSIPPTFQPRLILVYLSEALASLLFVSEIIVTLGLTNETKSE